MSKITMGRLVTMALESVVDHEFKKGGARFHRQGVKERRLRMEAVEELCVLLREAKKTSHYCSAFAEDAIAAVFDGDVDEARVLCKIIDPDDDGQSFNRTALAHLRPFVQYLRSRLEMESDRLR